MLFLKPGSKLTTELAKDAFSPLDGLALRLTGPANTPRLVNEMLVVPLVPATNLIEEGVDFNVKSTMLRTISAVCEIELLDPVTFSM